MINDDLKQLINGARQGVPADVEALTARFQRMIQANCALRLDDSSHVEDVAQEVTEQMLAGLSQLKNPEAFTSWLERIIMRTCARDNQRSRARMAREVGLNAEENDSVLNRLVDQDVSSQPEDSFTQGQTREQLLAHIRELPQSQRVPLVLHYFGAMSYAQIAEVLHIKIGTVSSNISKGKRNLNKMLLDE